MKPKVSSQLSALSTIAVLILTLSVCALAQVPSPNPPVGTTTSWSATFSEVQIPNSKSSFIGTSNELAFTVTPNFDIKQENIVGAGLQYYGFGANYRLPVISEALNNASPTINFLAFDFSLEATIGAAYSNGNNGKWAETFGGGVDYYLNNTWSLGAKIDYLKFPGYCNNCYAVYLNPKIHW